MIEVKDISNWQPLPHMNSGGTRNKKIVEDPNGDLYFFKESFNNGKGKFYPFEFYSEVIASFIGKQIGLNVLQYDIAVFGDKIGCLSKSMISKNEELIEGGKYLKAFDNTFIISNENPKEKYTFQLIVAALDKFNLLDQAKDHLLDLIIFDALIGNSDRHQENWGFIAENTDSSSAIDEIQNVTKGNANSNIPKWIAKILQSKMFKNDQVQNELVKRKLKLDRKVSFSPIYDSGCCLGRELTEQTIINYIVNPIEIEKYASKGSAEIHWDGITKKLSHFALINKLVEDNSQINQRVIDLISKIDISSLKDFIENIDKNIPSKFNEWKLTNSRKEFIVKLITLRKEKLVQTVNG